MDDLKEAIKNKTLEELRDYCAGNLPEARVGHYCKVEFQYRQTKLFEQQTEASIKTYESMKKDSKTMSLSLIFIALSAISTLIIAISSLFN